MTDTQTKAPHLKKVWEHHKDNNAWNRFNQQVANRINKMVFTMNTFWVFCCLALCSLPSVLSGFTIFAHTFPAWMTKVSLIALVAWIAQTFIQLVLLPAIGVNQNLQADASDARSEKTFEDTEELKAMSKAIIDHFGIPYEPTG